MGVALLALSCALVPSGPIKAAEFGACAGRAGAPQVRILVPNVRNDRGLIVATVYGEAPEDFLQPGKKQARERVPARAGETTVCVALPGPGTYAIAVFHDENGDKRLNRNLIGLPTEGYGFSNDAAPSLVPPGPPAHQEVRFRVGAETKSLQITLRY